jgi:uncharacterized membrane protein
MSEERMSERRTGNIIFLIFVVIFSLVTYEVVLKLTVNALAAVFSTILVLVFAIRGSRLIAGIIARVIARLARANQHASTTF